MLLILLLAASWAGAAEFPAPVGHVNDFAGVMKPETVQGLEGTLTSLKEKTGAEIAVVTVKTLGNLDVSTYAVRLMKEWGIGSKELNDGVLLLVSTGERKVRIEVGYGLEGAITDARSGLILREHIIPYLKDNDYDSGLNNGALALAQLIAKEKGADMGGVARPQAPPEPVRRSGRTRGMPFGQIILIAIFILVFLGRGRGGNGCLTGLLLGSMLGGGRGGYGGFSGGGFSGGFGGGGGGGFGGFGGGFSGGGGASGSF